MPRFFLDDTPCGTEVVLRGAERHHLLHVYRAQKGTIVELFDKKGNEYEARLLFWTGKEAILEIIQHHNRKETPFLKIFLAQGLIKNKSWDLLLQKAMELGLYGLLPMITQHLGDGREASGREERWHKVMVAAAKQCGRSHLISVASPLTFPAIIEKTAHFPFRILAHNHADLPCLKTVLNTCEEPLEEILVMIGSEGGFAESEIDMAKNAGIQIFSLGNYTLRAETAAIVTIANLNFYFSDRLYAFG